MKILVVTPYLPYANAPHGGGTLLFALLCELAKTQEIFLATMHEPDEQGKLDEVKKLFNVVCAVPTQRRRLEPIVPRRSFLAALRATVLSAGQYAATFLGKYAHLHADQRRFFQHLCQAIAQVQPDIIQLEYGYFCRLFARPLSSLGLTVGVAHDVEFKPAQRLACRSTGLERLAAWMRYAFIRRAEVQAYRHLKKVYTLSAFDAALLRQAAPALSVGVRRPGLAQPILDTASPQREDNMILFAGALYRPENLTAVDFLLSEVMPRVWQHEPCAHLHLVGAGAPAQLVQQTKGLPVVIHGYQERLSDFYARATLAVAPLFTGGGVIVKLLEALAYGVPTVASSIANEGIGATPEQEVLLADDAATFAKQILALLRSSELRARLSQQAKLFVQRHFNLQESVAELVQDYQALLAQHT